jgi:hypothetical protein
LNDTAGTHTNAGTAGSTGDFTDYGSPLFGATGPLGNAMYSPSAYLVNARNGTGGANDVLVTPNVSLSGWVYIRRATNFFGEIFNKQYFLNGWSAPFLSFGFQLLNTSDGQLDCYITIGGVLQAQLRTPTIHTMPTSRWCHLGGTWDGSTMKMYINGDLVTSGNYTGTIDYGVAGNRGQWYVGGIPGTSTNQDGPIIVQDVRVANIARPQSYFQNIYYNGMFVNG